jgi:class 3 adenylate cyclase
MVNKKEKEAVVLFVDIIDCSRISNALPIKEYAKFLKQFHFACNETFKAMQNIPKYKMKRPDECEFYVKGDECCIFLHKTDSNMMEIKWAIRFALSLHLNWLISPHNIENASKGILPVEIGVGIHQGLIYFDKFLSTDKSSEGYCINLAKRIEGFSREGKYSKIFISEHAYLKLPTIIKIQTKLSDPVTLKEQLKGINTTVQVRELEEANRELFIPPNKKISPDEFKHLEFCANALPNTEWLKLLVKQFSNRNCTIPDYIEDIRSSIVDKKGVFYWIREGEKELNNKNYSRAQEYIVKAVHMIPQEEITSYTNAVTLYSRWYFEKGKYDESIKWANLAIKQDKHWYHAYYYLIESLYRMQEYENCRLLSEVIKEESANHPLPTKVSNGYFYLKDAEMLCELKDNNKDKAEESLKQAFKLDTNLYNNIGQNKHLLKRFTPDELRQLKN